MPTISLCMIVKNEEDVLARCLTSVAELVDEIIIVDTGSDDKTVEIAEEYTSKIYSFPWINDFSAARNFSFSKATKEYCMWLDADDVIEETEKKPFLDLKASMASDVDFVMMKYNTAFDSDGKPTFNYYRERIIRNDGTHPWCGQVHEAIVPAGVITYSEVAVSHRKLHPADPDRNLNIYKSMIEEGKKLEPRHQYYYARELYYHELYEEALDVFHGFLDAKQGWVENCIEACSIAAECYKRLNKPDEALQILFHSFLYDTPRAEICCDIGKWFFEIKNLECAVFWYKQALETDRQARKSGFISPDCYDYLPNLQLCVCYDQLGDKEKAMAYNELAGAIKPDSPAYLWNKQYFDRIMKK